MSIFSIFSKQNKKIKKTGEDFSISNGEMVDENETKVDTSLSFHPTWNVEKEQEYVYRFLNNDLSPLSPNQLSLAGVDIKADEKKGDLHVTAFVRNSINKTIKLGETELILMDENNETIAKKSFNLTDIGELPPKSSRPWIFIFEQKHRISEEVPNENWKLAFLIKGESKEHKLDVETSWVEAFSLEQMESLEKIFNQLPPLKKNQLNISALNQHTDSEGKLHVDVFIRNTYEKEISLEQIPLQVLDKNGTIVSQGSFKLGGLKIKPNTTKPWRFIFPANMVLDDYQKENMSKWVVRIIENPKTN